MKRLLLLGVAVGVFALAARFIGPFRSAAAPARTGQTKTPAAQDRPLGHLVGQDLRVVVYAAPEGPRYSVLSATGEVLASNLTETEVGQQFPGLEIETMTADTVQREAPLPDH